MSGAAVNAIRLVLHFQFKEEKKADQEEIKRLNDDNQRLRNALKEAKNRARQVGSHRLTVVLLN